ncbi:MAG: polysaccharide deacetylase family protein [Flavobacteriaceae bacterium]
MLKAGLNGLYATGAQWWLAPLTRGMGIIFTLHHVRPADDNPFRPNGLLEITPDFLDRVIAKVKRSGADLVSLAEAHRRIVSGTRERRFVAFTLDDGYRDNLEHAAPVFRAHDCPYTVFVATGMPDGAMKLWWRGLERVIDASEGVALEMDGERHYFQCAEIDEKYATYERIYWWLRRQEEAVKLATVDQLCLDYKIDLAALCREASMSWAEIGTIAADPLCTIGAHTMGHHALAKLDDRRMRGEIEGGRRILADAIGREPEFFAYPYGDSCSAGKREFEAVADLGFKLAVTTNQAVISRGARERLFSLPRVSLNGDYQSMHYVDLLLSGVPFALYNTLQSAA